MIGEIFRIRIRNTGREKALSNKRDRLTISERHGGPGQVVPQHEIEGGLALHVRGQVARQRGYSVHKKKL